MRRISVFMALVGYGGLLVVLRPHLSNWPEQGLSGYLHSDPERALVDAAGLLGWCLAAWLFAVTALVIAARTPTAVGRLAGRAAHVITPRAARRLLEATLGVALAVGPAGAALANDQPALAPVPAPIVAAAEFSFPDLDRPTPSPAPSSAIPTSAIPTTAIPAIPPASTTPAPTPSTTSKPAPAVATPPSPPSHTVVPGDTLWDLATQAAPQASPAQITALWQQW